MRGGADGIVVHLREDKRHIQDKDVYDIKKAGLRLDLEMAATEEIKKVALDVKPEMVTLVPEKREEVTTEGGLNVKDHLNHLKPFIKTLKDAGIIVSIFIDPDKEQIAAAAKTEAPFIEIHTGLYANAKNKDERRKRLKEIEESTQLAKSLGLRVNAGHGLTHQNVQPIVKIEGIEELNIGFSIVARAIFIGLEQSVREMRQAMR
jgi:pyridoxine 5-phosphate synthase